MMDDTNAFDLGELLNANRQQAQRDSLVDLSGKPKPVNVRVVLNSGVEVRCDTRYSGVNDQDGDRLFTVVAEIDWENYWPTQLLVEELPDDVEFRFRVPGLPDEKTQEFCSGIRLMPDRILRVK